MEDASDALPQVVGGVKEEPAHVEEDEAVREQPVQGVLKGVGDGVQMRWWDREVRGRGDRRAEDREDMDYKG